MFEQRAYRRLSVELPARYRAGNSAAVPFEVTILDVGAEGMCFLSKHKVEPAQKIEIEVNLNAKDHVLLKTEVIWVRDFEKAGFKAGVRIVDASLHDEARFIKFYCQQLLLLSESSKKILIIEDEKDLAELLRMELERANYRVVCAYDGQEGFRKYEEEHPHLVILDVRLPKLNGFEICRKIRREKKDSLTPILMLTAQDEESDRIVGRVLGAEKYLTKPFNANHLLSEVSELLNRPHPAKKA